MTRVLECPNFPTLPVVAMEVLELTSDPDTSMSQIGSVVENDPAISVKILKTVNSSFYGLSKPCPTINRAITYLGLQVVKSLVLGFSLVDTFNDDRFRAPTFDLECHWRHSLYTAVSARELATRVRGTDEEQAFTIGLLSGIGILASVLSLKEDYTPVLEQAELVWGEPLRKIERSEIGFDHIEITCAFAEKWKFPPEYIQALRYSRDPESAPKAIQHLAMVIHLATESGLVLATAATTERLGGIWANLTPWLSIDNAERKPIIAEVLRGTTELSKLFELPDDPKVYAQISSRASEAMTTHQLEVARETEKMQVEAVTDGLTGLSNRKHFDEVLNRTHRDAMASGSSYAVMFFDADRFKSVNDTWGHQAGDEILKALAARAADAAGDVGTVFRYGGEEFCVLCPGCTCEQAAVAAEEIRAAIASAPVDISQLQLDVSELEVTVSIGVAATEGDAELEPNAVLRAADLGVYAAKQAGRNQVHTVAFDAEQPDGVKTAYASGPGKDESVTQSTPAQTDGAATAPQSAQTPAPENTASTPASASHVPADTTGTHGKHAVLIVEDDQLQAKLFALPLRNHSAYDVEIAHSGTDAIKLTMDRAQRGIPPFTLVITDLNMPGISGTDLVRNLRSKQENAATTFIVLTASDDDGSTKHALDAGATAVISKRSICDNPRRRVLEIVEAWAPPAESPAAA